jgi:hypothetical protein
MLPHAEVTAGTPSPKLKVRPDSSFNFQALAAGRKQMLMKL